MTANNNSKTENWFYTDTLYFIRSMNTLYFFRSISDLPISAVDTGLTKLILF